MSDNPTTYSQKDFARPSLTADCVILRGECVLLVKRKKWPYAGYWALPGGFVNEDEDPRDAAIRELHEETGVEFSNPQLVNVFGTKGRDPRGWIVSVAYMAEVPEGTRAVAGDDAEDTLWAPLNTVTDLAFDHNKVLAEALKLR